MNLASIRANSRFFALGNNSDTAFSDDDILSCSNMNYQNLVALAVKAQGDWSIIDRSKLQRNITAATRQYSLPATFLKIKRVEVKYPSSSGDYVAAKEISLDSIPPNGLDDYTPATPEYVKSGTKIDIFLPVKTADIAAVTNGINIYYEDEITALSAAGDETILPEFSNRLLCLLNAKDYCGVNSLTGRLKWILNEIGQLPSEGRPATGEIAVFLNFLKSRSEDKRPSIGVRREDYGQGSFGRLGGVRPSINGS